MLKQKGTVLGCFSPAVMGATFIIEIIMVMYVIMRYKLNAKGRTIVALIACLAAFQLAEYFVCTQSSVAIGAARAGYAAITMLPALGMYLMSLLTVPLSRTATRVMFLAALAFASYFLLAPTAFQGYQCTGNYVIFQIGRPQAIVYGMYYFGYIAWAVSRGTSFMHAKPRAKTVPAVRWFLLGYAAFIMPVAVLTVFHPDTTKAIPSILCGFAVILAVILGTRIAPLTNKRK